MKVKLINTILVFLLSFSIASSQIEDFNYKRAIINAEKGWSEIQLPDEIYKQLNPALSDLRIYGINTNGDTIEAPYILHNYADKIETIPSNVKIINQSTQTPNSVFIIETSNERDLNQLELIFKSQNYDWKITLEGSQDLNNWSTIITDYRILSVKNDFTEYNYSTVHFPVSKYRYFKITIPASPLPEIQAVQISAKEVLPGRKVITNGKITVEQDTENNLTEVIVTHAHHLPFHGIQIQTSDDYDYYRNIEISYLIDSTKSEKGWIKNYRNLTSGVLTSMDDNWFEFPRTLSKIFRIRIYNRDNNPLNINEVLGAHFQHSIKARFNDEGQYFLFYKNPKASRPIYDLTKFSDNIPDSLSVLSLGPELTVQLKDPINVPDPKWLNIGMWVLIIGLIIVIGGLTIRMLQDEPK